MWIDKNKKDNQKKRPQNRVPPRCPNCRKIIYEAQMQECIYQGIKHKQKENSDQIFQQENSFDKN